MLLASLAVLSPILLSEAAALDPSAERGEAIFREKCASCHTISRGDLVGPDLEGITAQRDPEWLARFIQEPDQMIAEGDPLALQLLEQYSNIPMPNQGLSQQDTDDVIAYIIAQSGGAPEKPPEKPVELAGDPLIGQSLFLGSTDFQSGGPPCQACHHVEGASRFGGFAIPPVMGTFVSTAGAVGYAQGFSVFVALAGLSLLMAYVLKRTYHPVAHVS